MYASAQYMYTSAYYYVYVFKLKNQREGKRQQRKKIQRRGER